MLTYVLLAAVLRPGQIADRNDYESRQGTPEARREARDRALRIAGKDSNKFFKHYGELGVQAVRAGMSPSSQQSPSATL